MDNFEKISSKFLRLFMIMNVMKKAPNIELEFTTAYCTYRKALHSYAVYKTHDSDASEDLVQNTFMKTWTYLVRGGKIIMMKSFLYHVMNNLVVDEYRKHKSISLDVLQDKGFEPGVDYSGHFLDMLDSKRMAELIRFLPERYKKVMEMRFVHDMSLEEMSRITGQSKNTMAVQVHRGIEKLKLLYSERVRSRKPIKDKPFQEYLTSSSY